MHVIPAVKIRKCEMDANAYNAKVIGNSSAWPGGKLDGQNGR